MFGKLDITKLVNDNLIGIYNIAANCIHPSMSLNKSVPITFRVFSVWLRMSMRHAKWLAWRRGGIPLVSYSSLNSPNRRTTIVDGYGHILLNDLDIKPSRLITLHMKVMPKDKDVVYINIFEARKGNEQSYKNDLVNSNADMNDHFLDYLTENDNQTYNKEYMQLIHNLLKQLYDICHYGHNQFEDFTRVKHRDSDYWSSSTPRATICGNLFRLALWAAWASFESEVSSFSKYDNGLFWNQMSLPCDKPMGLYVGDKLIVDPVIDDLTKGLQLIYDKTTRILLP